MFVIEVTVALTALLYLWHSKSHSIMLHRKISLGSVLMVKNPLMKDLMAQFFVPLLLTASGLAIVVFWPFAL